MGDVVLWPNGDDGETGREAHTAIDQNNREKPQYNLACWHAGHHLRSTDHP